MVKRCQNNPHGETIGEIPKIPIFSMVKLIKARVKPPFHCPKARYQCLRKDFAMAGSSGTSGAGGAACNLQ